MSDQTYLEYMECSHYIGVWWPKARRWFLVKVSCALGMCWYWVKCFINLTSIELFGLFTSLHFSAYFCHLLKKTVELSNSSHGPSVSFFRSICFCLMYFEALLLGANTCINRIMTSWRLDPLSLCNASLCL